MDVMKFFIRELERREAEDVVLKLIESDNYQIKFYNSKIDIVKKFDFKSMDIFVSYKKKNLVTNIRNFSKQNLIKKAKSIMKFIKILPDKDYYGIADGPFKYRSSRGMFYNEVNNVEKAVKATEKAIKTCLKSGAERVSGVLEGGTSKEKIMTNHNVVANQKQSSAYLSIRSLTENSSGHTTSVSRDFAGLHIEEKARESAELSLQGLESKKINPGKYDIIYYPLASAPIIESIGDAASIFSVETQSSCFANKINKKVGGEEVTILDDPTNNKVASSELFDDEGVPTKKNIIIKNGIFKKYLHNTSTARKHKTKTTGNAGLISPHAFSVKVKPGDSNLKEMIRTTKNGLVVTNTWYTRFQSYTKGDFSTIPRDAILLVRNGSITGSTYGIRVNDNIIRMLKNTTLIGKKSYPTLSWETTTAHQIPFFKVKNVLVTRPK